MCARVGSLFIEYLSKSAQQLMDEDDTPLSKQHVFAALRNILDFPHWETRLEEATVGTVFFVESKTVA